MDKKITGIIAYLTWIGLLIAYFAGDKEGAKFHINQALVICLGSVVSMIVAAVPLIGWLVAVVLDVFLFVCFVLGLISACKEEEKELPLIGQIKILK